jgi:hypothetical protein
MTSAQWDAHSQYAPLASSAVQARTHGHRAIGYPRDADNNSESPLAHRIARPGPCSPNRGTALPPRGLTTAGRRLCERPQSPMQHCTALQCGHCLKDSLIAGKARWRGPPSSSSSLMRTLAASTGSKALLPSCRERPIGGVVPTDASASSSAWWHLGSAGHRVRQLPHARSLIRKQAAALWDACWWNECKRTNRNTRARRARSS